ncbi:MAG: hypothetical protein KHZ77_06465 [Veillonella sp.]|uniref:hypothetical protein n=1 Tax=Veillonella sp. TaxID=1926307 RepID=UPI0025E3F072|nr:hypothetical protein [Veillonella sp.]MBS4913795.1 hypothetical protein [Veillonella sp.]
MEEKQSYATKRTSVLTEEERRAFDGVTIDEDGREQSEEDIRRENRAQTNGSYDGYSRDEYTQQAIPGIKIFTLSSIGWKGKLLIVAVSVILLTILFFFGSLFLIGFLVLAIGVGIVALLRKLF